MYGRNKGIQTEGRGELYAVTLTLRRTKGSVKIMLNSEGSRRGIMKEIKIKRDMDLLMKIWKLTEKRDITFEHVHSRTLDWKNNLTSAYAKRAAGLFDFKIRLQKNLILDDG